MRSFNNFKHTQIYYSVSVDGKEIHRVENEDARTFQDVRVFAGDKFYSPADASYRHLVWENIGPSGDVKRNTEIETIPTWGPLFRVSFDLKINSLKSGNKGGWSSVISFKGNEGKKDLGNHGDRIPAVFMNKNGRLHFRSSVSGNTNHKLSSAVQLKKWLRVVIEQNLSNEKVVNGAFISII